MTKLKTGSIADNFNEMVEMRNNGMTSIAIAKHFGVTRQRISKIFRDNDMPLHISPTEEDVKRIANAEELSKKFNITILTAENRMRKYGLPLVRGVDKRLSKITRETTIQMYKDYAENGLDQKQIALKYGLSQGAVSDAFIRHGFKTRDRSEYVTIGIKSSLIRKKR